MVARYSFIASIAFAAGAHAQSFAISDIASSIVSSSSRSSPSASITAAPSTGFSSNNGAKNSTTHVTAKPQTTISLFNACSGPDSTCKSLNDLTYYGAVISADKTKTIYALECSQQGKNASTECFSQPLTVTQGPSMFARVDDSGPVPTTVSCDIKSKSESAVCSQSYKATGGAAAGTITASAQVAQNSANSTVSGGSFNFGSDQIHYNALVITKGAEKLNGNGTIASKTPTAPTSSVGAPTATKTNGAGALTAPVALLAGVAAIAAFAF